MAKSTNKQNLINPIIKSLNDDDAIKLCDILIDRLHKAEKMLNQHGLQL